MSEDTEPIDREVDMEAIVCAAISSICYRQPRQLKIKDVQLRVHQGAIADLIEHLFEEGKAIMRSAGGISAIEEKNKITREETAQVIAIREEGHSNYLPQVPLPEPRNGWE